MKRWILLGLLGLAALFVAGLVLVTYDKKGGAKFLNRDCLSNPSPVFTNYPTDLNMVQLLMPPLLMVASGMKGHSYIDVTERVPIYAPADAILVEGVKYREDLGGRGELDQYTFTFTVSCEVDYFFDHIIDPPEKIAQAFSGPAAATTRSQGIEPIEISAGEYLGMSAGTGQHNFDFGVINTTKQTILADDPKYNHSDKYRHADCPYTYFEGKKKEALFNLLGYSNASDLQVIDNLCN